MELVEESNHIHHFLQLFCHNHMVVVGELMDKLDIELGMIEVVVYKYFDKLMLTK